tara:strand:+ start:1475 stop:1876 length:402 start_codon:yes stop_codon:yes gene_type:complete
MAAFSDYMEDAITAWINGTTFPSPAPSATFVQLYNTSPGDGGSATGALYSRVSVASGGWTRGTGGAGSLSNTGIITITSSASSAATATHFGVFDASAAGNLIFYGGLTPSAGKVISVGDEVKFNALQLSLTVA